MVLMYFVFQLLQPFLELRQACCHPQMVRGNVINLQKLKGTLTMEQLLEQLIKKTKIQCMDDHRLIVAALNGKSLNNAVNSCQPSLGRPLYLFARILL